MLVALVAQAPSCRKRNEHCYYDIDEIQAQVTYLSHKDRTNEGVLGGMQQHGQQQAPPSVMEDPGEDDRQGHAPNDKLDKWEANTDKAHASSIVSWSQQEQWEVPQSPEQSKEERSAEWAKTVLKAWQGKATPGRFLRQRTPDQQDYDEDRHVTLNQSGNWLTYGHDSSRWNKQAKQDQDREANKDKEIPP
jgi:hypothetical protein